MYRLYVHIKYFFYRAELRSFDMYTFTLCFVWLCDWFSCKRVFCTLMYKSCTWVSCAPLGDMKNNHTDDRKYCRGCATQRVNETSLKNNPPKVDLLNTYTAIIIVYFHLFICSFCYDSMIHFINYIKRVNISSKTLSFVFVIQYSCWQ